VKKFFLVILVIIVLSSLAWLVVRADSHNIQGDVIPEGFRLLKQVIGVRLFKKDYKDGTPDYVQVIQLDQGASLRLLHGKVTDTRPGKGAFGGNDARILSQSLAKYWTGLNQQSALAFCVTNGQFFYMPESPTRLTLPLKTNGEIITDGFGADQFVGKRLMLELWPDHADIRELNGASLYGSSAPEILGGLTVDANRRAKQRVGRTFAGVDDRDGNGVYETVMLFNTRTALQTDAADVLHSFGAEKVMMLDGGGSTQLMCQGEPIISSERLIPQAIAVFAGTEQILAQQPEPAVDLQAGSVEIQAASGEPRAVASVQELASSSSRNEGTGKIGVSVASTAISTETSLPQFKDIIWIPLGMLPVAGIVLVIAAHLRKQIYEMD
jgi:hypothetical protein